MPNRGRHRKGQLTVLPAGARVQTGKARTAAKSAAYNQLLPISVSSPHPAQRSNNRSHPGRRHGSNQTRPTQSSWSQFLLSLVGWGKDIAKDDAPSPSMQRPQVVRGRYDPLSGRVYIEVTSVSADGRRQESDSMRMLWECGFFGKGTLSRSEPTWKARQTQARIVQRQRARGKQIYTPEELTALRRKERKAAKIERARLAVRAGQQLADGIVALGGELNEEDEKMIARQVQRDLAAQQQQHPSQPDVSKDGERAEDGEDEDSAYGKHIPGLIYLKPKNESEKSEDTSKDQTEPTAPTAAVDSLTVQGDGVDEGDAEEEDFVDIEDNLETLVLSNEETFFLAGMLDVLDVVDDASGQVLSLEHLYALFLNAGLPPTTSPFRVPSLATLQQKVDLWARPDNPFLLQYVVYHHFRSLGWVVRAGTKFCVDWLLYKRGPAFGHAEFAIVVLPLYEDETDAQKNSVFGPHPQRQPRDWVWFSSVNRVNTQVLKTLILCYVTIPSASRVSAEMLATPQAFVDHLRDGKLYRISEFSIRRFTPQRMRA